MALSGRSSFSFWVLAALLAVAAGVGIALWRAPTTVVVQVPASAGSESAPAPMPAPPLLAGAPAAPVAPATLPPSSSPPPPGVGAVRWQQLQHEFADRPAELQRLEAYLRYADVLRRFRALPAAAGAERAALAQALDQGLDERLRQRELSAGEARQLKMAVLDVLVADATERQAALSRWETQQRAAETPDLATAAREAAFQRRQAAIVAAWSAAPAAQRDPQALERQLEALRRSSFPAPR